MVRRLFVVMLALLLAVDVIRNAAVAALGSNSPYEASRVWSRHPDVQLAVGMTAIGKAARERKPVGSNIFEMIDDAARKAPLAPEPFLVHGVRAQLAGSTSLAGKSFEAAELRDPRSLPAHYFLADYFYRSGDPRRALEQVAALARLTPTGTSTLAPYLAAYAKDRSTWPYLRDLFRSDANLEDSSLVALAGDPANADAVIAISNPSRRTSKAGWVPVLINSLINAGQYERARAVWAGTAHVRIQNTTLYDAGFNDSEAPPPFNWQLVSSTVGIAERQPGGRLHIIFYGHEDGVLAQQLLVLPPGTYRLSASVSAEPAEGHAMRWSIRCDKQDRPFAEVALDMAAGRAWVFSVPPQCNAQWLELSGTSSDVAQQSEFTISKMRLSPVGSNG